MSETAIAGTNHQYHVNREREEVSAILFLFHEGHKVLASLNRLQSLIFLIKQDYY